MSPRGLPGTQALLAHVIPWAHLLRSPMGADAAPVPPQPLASTGSPQQPCRDLPPPGAWSLGAWLHPPPDPLSPDLPHPVPCSNQATGLWPLLGLGHRKVLEWTAGKEVGVSAPPGGGATATKGAPVPCWPLLFVAPSLRPLIPFGGRWSVSSLKPCLQVSCC